MTTPDGTVILVFHSQRAFHRERRGNNAQTIRMDHPMNRFILPLITTSALIFGVFLPKEVAARTTAKDLIGTWTLVSVTLEQDGKKSDLFGPNPRGR